MMEECGRVNNSSENGKKDKGNEWKKVRSVKVEEQRWR